MRLLFFTSSPNLTLRAPGRRRCPGVIRVWGRGERQGRGLPPGGLSTARSGSEAPHSPSLPVPRPQVPARQEERGKKAAPTAAPYLRPICALLAPCPGRGSERPRSAWRLLPPSPAAAQRWGQGFSLRYFNYSLILFPLTPPIRYFHYSLILFFSPRI